MPESELRVPLPKELKEEMDEFKVNWPSVVRKLIKQKVERLIELKSIVSKSKLTEEDVAELSEKVDKSLAQRFRNSLKS